MVFFLALEFLGLEFSTGEILTVALLGGGFVVQSILARAQLQEAIRSIHELKRAVESNREKFEKDRGQIHGRLNRISDRVSRLEGRAGVTGEEL